MFFQGDNISHNNPYTVRLRIFCKQSQFSKMRVCSFKWCNKNTKLNKGTSFFYYPKCADMSRIWKELSGYDRDSKYAAICESHFNPKDLLVYEDGRKWLAEGAVPNYSGPDPFQGMSRFTSPPPPIMIVYNISRHET